MAQARFRFLCVAGSALAMLISTGCGYTNTSGAAAPGSAGATPGAGATGQPPATFTQVNSQILQPRCDSCHHSGGQAPDLSSYNTFATNTRYVVPGNPGQSLIYTITANGQMPPQGSALTQDQLNLLSSWIQSGAPNN